MEADPRGNGEKGSFGLRGQGFAMRDIKTEALRGAAGETFKGHMVRYIAQIVRHTGQGCVQYVAF